MSQRRTRAFQTLRHRDFRLIWAADTISRLGTQMQQVAIIWHVFDLTRDPLQLGLLGLFRFAPLLVFGVIGGVVADQQDRRKVLIASHLGLMLTSGVLAAATFGGQVSLALIYGVTFVSAMLTAMAGPARQAIIPSLVPRAELAGAATVANLSMQIASVIGPPLGGVIIEVLGVGTAYSLDAASFVAVIIAVVLMKTSSSPISLPVKGLAAVKEGFAFLWATPILLAVMSLDFIAMFFGTNNTLMPIFAEEIFDMGAGGLGLLLGTFAAGAVLGGLVMSVMPVPQRPGWAIVLAIIAYGVCVAGFGLSQNVLLALLFLAGSGAADSVSMAMRNAMRNLITPDQYRGRIAAAHSTFAMGGPQLGEFRAGTIAALIGVQASVVIGGIATVIACLIAARIVPALVRYDSSTWSDEPAESPPRQAPADGS